MRCGCRGRGPSPRIIGPLPFSQALAGLGAGLFFPFISIFFVDQLHATTATYGALIAVTAGLALVSLASALLADRFGRGAWRSWRRPPRCLSWS